MAAVNSKIDKDDYNNIRTKVVDVLGNGSGNFGYGQALASDPVTVSNKVSINEYANLQYDIINAYKHQNGTAPTLPQAVENAKVRFNTSNAPVSYWETIANNLRSNRFNVHYSQRISNNHGSATPYTSSWGKASSQDELTCIVTFQWSTSDQARHFFNSGGRLYFSSSRSGGSSTAQNAAWTSLLSTNSPVVSTTLSGVYFGGATPGTGTAPLNGLNFYRCTSGYSSTWFSFSSSSPYGSNTWRGYARTPGVGDNSNGSARTLEIKISWFDGHTALGAGPDNVDGQITLDVGSIQASGLLTPAALGSFSVTTPSVTIGSITRS
jgi:hypothetical protein